RADSRSWTPTWEPSGPTTRTLGARIWEFLRGRRSRDDLDRGALTLSPMRGREQYSDVREAWLACPMSVPNSRPSAVNPRGHPHYWRRGALPGPQRAGAGSCWGTGSWTGMWSGTVSGTRGVGRTCHDSR